MVQLVFDVFKEPRIKMAVSTKPILGLDLGFTQHFLFIFYRVEPNIIHCLRLESQ